MRVAFSFMRIDSHVFFLQDMNGRALKTISVGFGLSIVLSGVFAYAGPAQSTKPASSRFQQLVETPSDDAHLLTSIERGDGRAIQTAIDSLPPSGGQILVSSGVYTCKTAIVISRDNVELRGQGASTVLYLADGSDSPVLVVGDTATPISAKHRHIRVSDLLIDGNKANQTVEGWGGPCDSGGLTVIRNNGITIRGATDVLIERVEVYRARSGGLVAEKGCERLTVRDFTAAENYYDGIGAYETKNSLFSGLHLHDNAFAGMSLDIHFNHNIVSEAVMTNNGKQGIFMRDSRDNLFSSIYIRGSGEQGLFLAQTKYDPTTPAAGNTFEGLVVAKSVEAGMRVNNPSCVDNLVVGAQFIDNAEGISEASPGLVEQVGVVCR